MEISDSQNLLLEHLEVNFWSECLISSGGGDGGELVWCRLPEWAQSHSLHLGNCSPHHHHYTLPQDPRTDLEKNWD